MDMSRFSEVTKAKDGRLRQHTDAIRENPVSVATVSYTHLTLPTTPYV